MRVLIVEDDPSSRLLLEKVLAPYGYCDLVTNGREAMKAFTDAYTAEEPYDLVCLDIMMPEMGGHETLKGIRSFEARKEIAEKVGVKVIMTTALDDKKNVLAAFREGCEAYLVKPILPSELIKKLESLDLIAATMA